MPWSYLIGQERKVIFTTATGTFTEQDLEPGLAAMHRDPLFHPDFRVLGDYTEGSQVEIAAAKLAALSATYTFAAQARRAYLVRSPTVAGYLQFYGSHAERGNLRTFYDRGAALAWLNEGMPPEEEIK